MEIKDEEKIKMEKIILVVVQKNNNKKAQHQNLTMDKDHHLAKLQRSNKDTSTWLSSPAAVANDYSTYNSTT
jgi:hypothetical protein